MSATPGTCGTPYVRRRKKYSPEVQRSVIPDHEYATHAVAGQALKERLKLDIVATLRRLGRPATCGELGRELGQAPAFIGKVAESARNTLRADRVETAGKVSAVVIDLHPHLKAWA